MRIVLLIEGKTEKAFCPFLESYLRRKLSGKMPRLSPKRFDGGILTGEELKKIVLKHLTSVPRADHVIALTDVYPKFESAQDAKQKMQEWVGNESRFHPHTAQYEFEAWLLPYWDTIQKLADHNKRSPGSNPETVNHQKPPSFHIKDIFETGKCDRSYSKTRDAPRILRNNDLSLAIEKCPELKSMINTILSICGAETIG